MAAGVIPAHALNDLRVLVVHANFAVGSAIARRLIDADVVALAHTGSVLGGHQDPRDYHAVLLCPYLPGDERDALLAACLDGPEVAVVELCDSELGGSVLLHRSGLGSPSAADVLSEALSLPLAAPEPV
jgi:hypothetical protein